jgi:uncharacterized protein YqeY
VERETAELAILEAYLPAQMSNEEIAREALQIMKDLGPIDNLQKSIGQTIGAFNKRFAGKADSAILRAVIENLARGLNA